MLTLSTKRDFPGVRAETRVDSVAPPEIESPFEAGSLIEAFVLSRDRTTWMCDLCSYFVRLRNRNSSIRENGCYFCEREGENESGNAWNTHVRVTNAWLESDRGMNRVEINHHLEGLGIFETVNTHTYTTLRVTTSFITFN